MDRLLNEREAAKMLNCSVQLLRKWRATNQGPGRVKMGRCIRYSIDDLRLFVEANRRAFLGASPGNGPFSAGMERQ